MKVRGPLAASSRYYPGFFGALFLVLLRLAIGWHFLYEGTQKILSTPWGKASVLGRTLPPPDGPPFTSEGYLRNASGPFAPRFRALGDVEGRRALDPAEIKADRSAEVDRFVLRYKLDDAEKAKAAEALAALERSVDDWFQSADNRDRVKKYLDGLDAIAAIERKPDPLSFEVEEARARRRSIDADRKDLVKEVDALTWAFRDDLVKVAGPDRLKAAGDYQPPPSQIQAIDLMTMWGLTAIGLCLMLGLFTPLAAVGGAAYLLNFYLSMPPWPGLPEGITEGHYLYVNKNLIEMLACLALAATPSGLWIGLDAVLFGWIGRGRRRREALALAEASTTPPGRPSGQDRRKFKNR